MTTPELAAGALETLNNKTVADTVQLVSQATVAGASSFLSLICRPAAEEFGLLLKDKVSAWRAQNAADIAWRAEKLLKARNVQTDVHAPPRIIARVIEMGSWNSVEEVQQVWAGLLASACTPDGDDDCNLIFLDLLSKLTASQIRLLNHICASSTKVKTLAGWISADEFKMNVDELSHASGITDL